jgi:hypothetical protein
MRENIGVLWVLSGWAALVYIAIREKWNTPLAVTMFFLLLVPAAVVGPFLSMIAAIFVPTGKFLSRF